MQIFYLLLILTVFKINSNSAADETCNLLVKGSQDVCTYLDNHVHPPLLSQKICGCIAGIFQQDVKYCDRAANIFGHIPECAKIVQSKMYDELIANKLTTIVVKVVLTAVVGVCSETDPEVQANLEKVFTNKAYIKIIEFLFPVVFPEQGDQLNKCYKQIRERIVGPKK